MAAPTITVGDLALQPPEQWALTSLILFGPTETTAAGPDGAVGHFQQNIVIMTQALEEGKTIEDFVEQQQQNLQAAGVLHRAPRGHEDITIAGAQQAMLVEHVLRGENGEKVRQLQLIAQRQQLLLVATASNVDGVGFESNRESYRQILTNLRWGS